MENNNENIGNRVYVANLNYDLSDEEFRKFFEEFGKVTMANIVKSQEGHKLKSSGFGFVTFATKEEAQNAITKGNELLLMDRKLVVREALPSRSKDSRRDDGGFSGRGRGRGGYNNRSTQRGGFGQNGSFENQRGNRYSNGPNNSGYNGGYNDGPDNGGYNNRHNNGAYNDGPNNGAYNDGY